MDYLKIPRELKQNTELYHYVVKGDNVVAKPNKIRLLERVTNHWREGLVRPIQEVDDGCFHYVKEERWLVEILPNNNFEKLRRDEVWVLKYQGEGLLHFKDEIDEEE